MIYPSLAKIRSFIAAAEHASFRKASEELHLSQPALSAHVRDLERGLGVSLLSRTTRSVRLTPEGRDFLVRSKRALAELEAAVLDLQDQAALRRGRVTVACVPTIASSRLPMVLARFAAAYPAIRVHILDEVAETLYRRVIDRDADFGIGPAPGRQRDLSFAKLVEDHFIAVFRRDHKLAGRRTVALDELIRFPFLALTPGVNVRVVLERAFAERGHVVDPVYEVSHHYTLGGLVEAGLGVTALPSMSLSLLGHPWLDSARIVDPEITRDIGILRRRDDAPTPAASAFLKVVSEVFGERAS